MIKKNFILILSIILNKSSANSMDLSIVNNRNMTIISVDSDTHIDYGLSYPITYEFSLPNGIEHFKAYRKFRFQDSWELIEEKTSDDFFNGIEAARFDYESNIGFLSVGFSSITDSIYLKIMDIDNNNLEIEYLKAII